MASTTSESTADFPRGRRGRVGEGGNGLRGETARHPHRCQGQEAGWSDAQDKLALLSTNSVHRTIQAATHADLLVDKRFAEQSSTAIVEVVAAARTHAVLAR